MSLKELRISKGLTQKQAADYLQVPSRTYSRYETDEQRADSIKYKYMIDRLEEYGLIDENHGLLDVEKIKSKCEQVFKKHKVNYCYLFGSYAKGKATESSDVDLLISTQTSGMKFYGLVEELRESLKKNVDVLNDDQIKNNPQLVNEILSDGIKIYGKH